MTTTLRIIICLAIGVITHIVIIETFGKPKLAIVALAIILTAWITKYFRKERNE